MKVFDQAVWKLTSVYSAILLVVVVGFSVGFYFMADAELNRPWQPRPEMIRGFVAPNGAETVRIMISQRDNEMRNNLLLQLTIIDLGVLIVGAVASYFLARRTLRPVNEAMEKQSRFVSDASHELRTPLTAIAMENEVLLRDVAVGKDDLKKQLASNLEEVNKLSELSDRLLKLSRDEKLTLEEIDIALPVASAVAKVMKQATSEKIVIENKVKSRKLTTNADALEQILVILLDNAIKFSPKNSTVTIGDKNGKIYVRDQGPGIAPEDLPHIFDRFYRAEKSRSSQGYGLGLALAKQLADEANLKVSATNHKPTGAMFYIN